MQALLQPGNQDRSRLVRFVEKMLLTSEARQELVTQLSLNASRVGELMDAALPIEAPRAQIVSKVVADSTARGEVEEALVWLDRITYVNDDMSRQEVDRLRSRLKASSQPQ